MSIQLLGWTSKALAALCLQTTLLTLLKKKGIVSDEDLLAVTGTALQVLDELPGLSIQERARCETLLQARISADAGCPTCY